MKWDEVGELRCSVARALSVVGDRWTLLILRNLFRGLRRFEDLQRDLGITRHLLIRRLRKLIAHGVVERVPYQRRPTRYEYRLTEMGLDLQHALLALAGWGDRWLADEGGPPVVHLHRGCGGIPRLALHCPECGERVSTRDVAAQVRPATGP